MKIRRKLLSVFLSAVLLLIMAPYAPVAGSAADSDFVINDFGVLIDYTGPGGEVVIPAGVQGIGKNAFTAEDNIVSVVIPGSVTNIYHGAFNGCSTLKDVIFTQPVTVSFDSFIDCDQVVFHCVDYGPMRSLAIEYGFGFEPFPVLTDPTTGISVQIRPYQNAVLKVETITSGQVYDQAAAAMRQEGFSDFTMYRIRLMQGDTAIDISDHVAVVTLPNTLKTDKPIAVYQYIEDLDFLVERGHGGNAGMECYIYADLEYLCVAPVNFIIDGWDLVEYVGDGGDIAVPKSINSINSHAFQEHPSLTSVVMHEWVYAIKSNAFEKCHSLTDVYVYGLDVTIEPNAFSECEKVTLHGFAGSSAETYARENSIDFEPFPTLTDPATGIAVQTYLDGVTLQVDTVTSGQMYDTFAAELQQEGVDQFTLYHLQLKQGNTPLNIQDNLLRVTIPNPNTSGRQVVVKGFDEPYSMTVDIWRSKEAQLTFSYFGLGYFCVYTTNFELGETDNLIRYHGTQDKVVIPDRVFRIDSQAFTADSGITSVVLSAGIIRDRAFDNCDTLTDVYFYYPYTEIAENAFFGCDNVKFYGYTGSTAEAYAKEFDIEFIPFPVLTDEATGISAQIRPTENATLQVTPITSGSQYDLLKSQLEPSAMPFVLYDIQVTAGDKPIDQPWITIPKPTFFGKLWATARLEDGGRPPYHIDIHTEQQALVYDPGTYLVVNVSPYPGDINWDQRLNATDARILLQRAVGKIGITEYVWRIVESLKKRLDYPYVGSRDDNMEPHMAYIIAQELILEYQALDVLEDLNNDGKISVTDARLALQMTVHKHPIEFHES